MKSSIITETNQQAENPYVTPQKFVQEAMKSDNLLMKGFVTVVASSLFFGLLGGVVGMMIGLLLPQYYDAMFPRLNGISGQHWKLGVGLGVTQGLVAGTFVGCVVLLSTAWYKSRMSNSIAQMVAQAQALQSTSPQVELQDDVNLAELTKSKPNADST